MKKNVEKSYTDKKTGKFSKGNPGGGRPLGQRNYAQIYREALAKIAQLNKITPEDLEDDIIKMAISKARKGDPIFYKDVMDRIHGKPVQPVSGKDGGPIELNVTGVEITVRK